MIEREKRKQRCCFTGHRPEKLCVNESEIKPALAPAIESAIAAGKLTFISGMSRGVDIWAAELVLQYRKADSSIHLICALPYPDFERRWSAQWQQRYREILQRADLIRIISASFSMSSYQIRNEWMVNKSSLVIAVFNGENGGTKNTIEYANAHDVEVAMIETANAAEARPVAPLHSCSQ